MKIFIFTLMFSLLSSAFSMDKQANPLQTEALFTTMQRMHVLMGAKSTQQVNLQMSLEEIDNLKFKIKEIDQNLNKFINERKELCGHLLQMFNINLLSLKEFAEELGLEASSLDRTKSTFNYDMIVEKFDEKLSLIPQEQERYSSFVKAWINYKIEYLMEQEESLKAKRDQARFQVNPLEVIQEMKKQSLIEGEPSKIKSMQTPESLAAEQIIFIKFPNQCSLVSKVFKNIGQYNMEKHQMSYVAPYVNLLNEHRNNYEGNLPIIVPYKGCFTIEDGQTGVMIFGKAKGKTLQYFIDGLPQMEKHEITNIFTCIGAQLGRLDTLIYKITNGKRLWHGDLHSRNMMFHEKRDQLFWIDYGELLLAPYGDDMAQDQLRIAKFSKDLQPNYSLFLKEIENLSESVPDRKEKIIELSKEYLNILQKKLLAYHSLHKAYLKEMTKVGLSLGEAYNRMCMRDFEFINQFNEQLTELEINKKIDTEEYKF